MYLPCYKMGGGVNGSREAGGGEEKGDYGYREGALARTTAGLRDRRCPGRSGGSEFKGEENGARGAKAVSRTSAPGKSGHHYHRLAFRLGSKTLCNEGGNWAGTMLRTEELLRSRHVEINRLIFLFSPRPGSGGGKGGLDVKKNHG